MAKTELLQFEVGSVVEQELRRLMNALEEVRRSIFTSGAVHRGVLYSDETFDTVNGDPAELLAYTISDWDCIDNTENGVVHRYPGIFEVSPAVIECFRLLNSAKMSFQETIRSLEHSGATPYQMRLAYRAAGHSRIHPLQAWRQISILDGGISSVGFTVAKQLEGIERLEQEQVVARLYACGANEIAELVASYAKSTIFRWHTPVSPHVRANIVWGQGETAARRMIHASLPFLVPEAGWPSKRVRFNLPRERENNSERSKKRLDATGTLVANLPFRKGAYLTLAQ